MWKFKTEKLKTIITFRVIGWPDIYSSLSPHNPIIYCKLIQSDSWVKFQPLHHDDLVPPTVNIEIILLGYVMHLITNWEEGISVVNYVFKFILYLAIFRSHCLYFYSSPKRIYFSLKRFQHTFKTRRNICHYAYRMINFKVEKDYMNLTLFVFP